MFNLMDWTKPLRGIGVARPSLVTSPGHSSRQASLSALMRFLSVLHCESMEWLLAAHSISQGVHHDTPSATHDRRHAGAESRTEHANSYVQQVSCLRAISTNRRSCWVRRTSAPIRSILTNEKKLAPSSVLITVSALRFLYKVSLKKDWSFEDMIPTAKKPQSCP